MGKYLIQDIVPAGKKHRITKSHSGAASAEPVHHHRSTHHAGGSDSGEHSHHSEKHHSPISHLGEDAIVQHEHEMGHDEVYAAANAALGEHSDIDTPLEAAPIVATPHVLTEAEEPKRQFGATSLPPSIDTTAEFDDDFDGRKSWLPWTIGSVIVLIVIGFVLNLFSGATVSLIPKSDSMPIDQRFTALKEPVADELAYSVMKLEESASSEVPATGTKTVTTKASGRIIVYNEQTVVQRLIKNTRFESPQGKIYRINESITIPKKAGTKIGTLEVTVYADEAGADYNTEPTDFTVPGLKNTPLATKVYARGKGPITGGASGTIKSVADQDLKQAQDDLRVALETKLRSKARGNLSPSQIAFDRGVVVDLEDPVLSNEKATSEDRAVVKGTGAIYVIVFDRKQLTKAIAKASIPTYAGEEITLDNLDTLTFGMATTTGKTLWDSSILDFGLSGTPRLQWVINEELIKKELLGLPKAQFNVKMAKYVTVERAKASLRPFWKQSFPADPKNITIKIVDEIKD